MNFGDGALHLGGAAVSQRQVYFQYAKSFLDTGLNPSPLKLPLDGEVRPGEADLEGLPGLLHDSLPDGWSRLVLDRHIRTRGYDPASLGVLDRLGLVGRHGAGALVYQSAIDMPVEAPAVDFDTAAALITRAPWEEDADRVQAALTLTRSLGGARPKAYVYLSNGAFSTKEDPNARAWIVKFPAAEDGPEAGAVEYAYSLMAREAGIIMPETRLLQSRDTGGFFAVERFDRLAGGGRLHVHSLGGLLNAPILNAVTYTHLMMVTGSLSKRFGTDVANIEQQIHRMAFNVLARNRDDHVKNHAFLMDVQGRWACAPAYDLTFSNLSEHALLVGGQGRSPGMKDMLEVARAVRIPDERTLQIVARVREAVGSWLRFSKEAGVSQARAKEIDGTLNARGTAQMQAAIFLGSPENHR
ncbi:MAG: type II toxin-antitoxin system HipA family toxin [Sphingomonadales bacterium]|nr:type II toxin-antitoxin system HipA family toxin [Sphingomonadales bacterium]MDE2171908.1 type II toxin-antitoxin system HipA family toxin [Sphingomonadales bacterium]